MIEIAGLLALYSAAAVVNNTVYNFRTNVYRRVVTS